MMKVLNDLLGYDLKIYQNDEWFCFSIDGVLLAKLVNVRYRDKKILDIGSGNGIIPILLSNRTNSIIEGVELQKDLYDLAIESVNYNNLGNSIKLFNKDIKDFATIEKYNSYDLILCNPPYFKNIDSSKKNMEEHKFLARHEINLNIDDVSKISSLLLKNGGTLAIIHRTERLLEIIDALKKNNLEPKRIRFIYDNINVKPDLFIIEATKNGKSGLEVDIPFVMYDDNGNETVEYKEMIGGNNYAK